MSQKVDQSTSHSSSISQTSPSAALSIPCSSSLASQPQSSHKRTQLTEINPALTCILCSGYFIDATTIIECLHSFCKSCIVKYLETNKCCPICDALVHKTKPLSNIRSDKILQDIVYKLIPDVFKNEMQRRRDYYVKHPEAAPTTAEDRGEVPEHRMFYMPYDKISLSLEYGYGDNQIPENGYRTTPANQQTEKTSETETMRRYLLCPAGLSILHLKKFIATKYGLPNTYKVDVMYLEDILSEDYTLMDVAYIYAWRRSDPMRLFYRICERPIKRLKTTHPQTIESKSGSGSSLNNTNSNLSNSNNANNNNSVSQSKLVASTSTSNTSTLSTIMTGAANLPTLPTLPSTTPTLKNSNNSGPTGVTSTKRSNTTPKNADTISAYRVTSSPTAATPQGIFKSMSASAVQTDEPPKKLRKILPANNSTITTPKAVPITTSINCSTSTPTTTLSSTTTSSSTVNSLRQCRINTDKNKSLCSTVNTNSSVGLSVSKPSVKEETKCVNSAITTTSLGSNITSAKKNSSRKSSAFDVRTLIGTKSPTLPSQRQSVSSAISGNESKDEIRINEEKSSNTTKIGNSLTNIGNSLTSKPVKGNSNVRELNRNTVTSSMCSMPSSLSSITTGSSANKKPLSNSSSVAISRPPTNRSTSPKVVTQTNLRPFVPLKITKSGTFVSPKQLNTKSLKASQNDISVKTRDNTNTNNKITKDVPLIQPNKPQRQSNPLSPPSIRIKLPPPPTTTSPVKQSCATTSLSNSKNSSNAKEQTQQSKQTESSRQQDLNKSLKIGLTQNKSVQNITQNQSHSKSSISQTSLTKTKGAAINQIVSKIASAVTAKSTSVNVTSTTPTLELSKSNISGGQISGAVISGSLISGGLISGAIASSIASGLSSTKVSANEVNDDKVSTTTNESGVSSSIHKDDSAIKAVTSATTNTGNLVIRISTKSSLKDKDKNSLQKANKFEIKRDLNTNFNTTETQCLNGKNDNNHKSEIELKSNNILNDDEDDDDDDDNSIDGRKLVVDENSCENEVGTSKVTLEMDDIDSGRGSDIIRLSCDDIEMGSPQSTTLSIKTPESLSASSDISTKLAINITSTTTLSANSAVLASPPPTPSPKSESDPCITVVTKSNKSSSSSSPNGPLDLSMSSSNKKEGLIHEKIVTPPAIYDIPAPKPKHCVNPAVLDKHRGLFPPSNAPNKQHPSFKIIPTPSTHSSRQSNQIQPQQSSSFLSTNFNSKKDRSINSSIITTGSSSSNQSRNRSQVSHHHQHHHHKNYSVITPDPHRYTPKLVIKNISSPPSITSHFNYPTHH